jgi:hypothetical protein
LSFPEGAKAPVDSVRLHGPEWPALHLASTVSLQRGGPGPYHHDCQPQNGGKATVYQSLHRGRKAHGAEHAKRAASLASRWLKGTPAMENRNPSARKPERGRFPAFCLLLERSRRSLMHVVLHASFVVRHHLFRLRLLVGR